MFRKAELEIFELDNNDVILTSLWLDDEDNNKQMDPNNPDGEL